MTGLDPQNDVIVEVATLITDDQLNIVAEGPDLVIYHPPEVLSNMDDFVRSMHTRSGLIKEIENSSITAASACEQTLAFIKEHVADERTVPLCGNSIGTDRRFLSRYWPEIENYLHYRSVDVSTIKELAKRWYPADMKKVPDKGSTHRALDDIRESIKELQAYRELFFKGVA